MEIQALMKSKSFVGKLSKNSNETEVSFSVGIGISGEAIITFERFPLDAATIYISDYFHNVGTDFEKFWLRGAALDGTMFECDDILFTSLGNNFFEDCQTICPVAHYSLAKLTVPCESHNLPVLIWRLKGFQSFAPLSDSTNLGTVEMVGAKDMDGKDEISGFIRITATKIPNDLEFWRESAAKFFDHIRHVMSFSVNVELAFPVTEFVNRDRIEVALYSRSKQRKSVYPPFNWLHLQEIFRCAVRCYFEPVIPVKNLFFAIQWFNMHGLYREANLISAMTVLENLIDSNLTKQDGLLLGDKTFEALRKKLSSVVKEQAKTWTSDEKEQQAFVCELNNRFSDLKRRSLIEKLNLLATRWGVRLDDIDGKKISAAKAARDQVVHRGHYVPSPKAVGNLHDHLLTVRELVVRFILTALQFEGRYYSYVDGQLYREFHKNSPKLDYRLAETP
jgi:hypothetical protein